MLEKLQGQADPALVEKLKATLAEHKSAQAAETPKPATQSTKIKAGDAHDSPHDPERVRGLVRLCT